MQKLCNAIEDVVGPARPLNHHEPLIGPNEQAAASRAATLLSSSVAQAQLSSALARYIDAQFVCLTNTGTAALQLAISACGIQTGEEILMPSLTFAATANAAIYAGAIPHFVDGGVSINAYKLRRHLENNTSSALDRRGRINKKTQRRITAIIAVDLLGYPSDYEKLKEVAEEFGLTLIEDAAEALGAEHHFGRCGNLGHASILSFNNNKIVTGGGGGAILTDDEWVATQVGMLSTQYRQPHPWKVEVTGIGFNFRMPTMCAAVAYTQLKDIDKILVQKQVLFDSYKSAGLKMLDCPEWLGVPNYWLSTALVNDANERDELLKLLKDRNIYGRALFTPLHTLEPYKDFPRMPNMLQADDLFAKAVCLPSGKGALACDTSSFQVAAQI